MLNHFQTLLLFALFASLAFAFLSKRKLGERVKYAIWTFLAFVLIAIAIGWLMYPFTR
jgi:multidrug transporter EmrE-like cation transporter